MKKIGVFYGSSTGNTELVADKIQILFGEELVDVHNIDSIEVKDVESYQYLIFGTSTWGMGDLQDDWEDFLSLLKEVNFKGKKLALFGLGDQEVYTDSFVNGMGKLYKHLPKGTNIVGKWPIEAYRFRESEAVQDGRFVGLALDYDNEPKLTDELLKYWVDQLEKEFV
jgi:flavodoxin I